MNLEKFSLEKFLTNWVVLENIDYNIDNSIINKISIEHQNMVYPLGYRFRLDEYLVDECGYPYYNEEEYSKCQYLRIEKSDEFRYPSDYHPKVFSVNEFGKPKQLLINGILVNEKIDEVTNPIVLEYQKEQFQKLSDDMKLSYENELKMRKDEERLKEERVQKLNEEKGFSVNSFPID
jgi:hypothetical protein